MTIPVEIDDRITKCQKILDLDPNSQIFAALAEAYRKRGDLDKAFRICQNGLKTHPSYGSAHIVMAKINLDRGLYDWAEAEVGKAVEIDGRSRAIDLLLAEIYIYKGQFDDAVKLLATLHRSDPDNRQIKKLLDIATRLPEEQRAAMSRTDADSSESPNSGRETPLVKRTPAAKTLDQAGFISEALSIPELTGALFINKEGLVIESQWELEMDAETCGAGMADANNYINQELSRYSFGHTSAVLIETANQLFYLVTVDEGFFVLAGSEKTNLGTLRMKLADLFSRYQV
jgi:predicted regulator of Ras-like GTPase activity (Roadblock/LC7/MglB family)